MALNLTSTPAQWRGGGGGAVAAVTRAVSTSSGDGKRESAGRLLVNDQECQRARRGKAHTIRYVNCFTGPPPRTYRVSSSIRTHARAISRPLLTGDQAESPVGTSPAGGAY
ncbi:hypothetical protein J6590_034655 [Homalodisca vitripennis]|nr:hypothetical protein J6590_034655 [Homalodisca vitripennis]